MTDFFSAPVRRLREARHRVGRGLEAGATAVEYALMVGLVAIGIITAVTTLKDNVSTVLEDAAGQTYEWKASQRTVNMQLLVKGNSITGSIQDPKYYADRESRISGTWIGTTVDFVRTANCQQRFLGTTLDNGKTITGTATELVAGTCGGSFAFTFTRIGG